VKGEKKKEKIIKNKKASLVFRFSSPKRFPYHFKFQFFNKNNLKLKKERKKERKKEF